MTSSFGLHCKKQENDYKKILEKFLLTHAENNEYLGKNELLNLVLDNFYQGFKNLQNNVQGDGEHLSGIENYIKYLKDSWGLTISHEMIPMLQEIFFTSFYHLQNLEREL